VGRNIDIKKVPLGNTGLNVSKLCWGTLSFSPYHSKISPEDAGVLLKKGFELGINFWDGAELYESYRHIRAGLEALNYNDNLVISSRSYSSSYKEMLHSIDKCRKELNKACIEIFGLHEVQTGELDNGVFRPEALRALSYAKEAGIIKAVSLTTHSAKVALKVAEIQEIDIIMPLINYKGIGIKDGSLADMEKAIKKAKKNGKGVFAMKVLAGGLFAEKIENALNYVLSNPNIDSTAIGMSCLDELYFNHKVFTQGISEKSAKHKFKSKRVSIEPWCSACGKCVIICPQNALFIEHGLANINHDKCILCGYCISACKDFNIKFVNQ